MGLLLIAAIVATVLVHALDEARKAQAASRHSAVVIQAVGDLRASTGDLESGLRGYAVTRDDRFLAGYNAAVKAAPRQAGRLAELVADNPPELQRAAQLAGEVRAYARDYGPAALAAIQSGRDDLRDSALDEGMQRADAMRALFHQIGAEEQRLVDRRRGRQDDANRRALVVGLIGLGVLALATLLFAAYTVRAGRRIQRITEGVRDLEAGDLAARVPEGGEAELGELSLAFNHMAASLQAGQARLEELSSSSAAILDSIYRQSPVGLAVVDRAGRLLRVNEALAEMSAVPVDGQVGRPVAEVLPWLAPLADRLGTTLSSGATVRRTLRIPAGDGRDEARTWEVACFPVTPEGRDEPVGAGFVVDDVTERERVRTTRLQLRERELVVARREARLERLSRALSEALSGDDVRRAIVVEGARAFGAQVAVLGELDRPAGCVWFRHYVGMTEDLLQRFASGPVPLSTRMSSIEAILTGEPVIAEDASVLREEFPDLAGPARNAGLRGTVAIPLSDNHGEVTGVLAVGLSSSPTDEDADTVYLQTIGDRCSQALERARLYDREHTIAEILQRGHLPSALPEVQGLELASRFRAAGEGVMVGGDFYDVVERSDRSAVVCLGDVAGKGPAAAALAGLARHAFRLATDRSISPGDILGELNVGVRRHHDPSAPEFLTAVCVAVEPLGDGLRLLAAAGGHPGPLIVRADGRVELTTVSGPLLGVLEDVTHAEVLLVLAPGDSCILFTDGLLEAQAPSRIDDPQALAGVLRAHGPGTLDQLLDALMAYATDGVDDPRDDLALLGLRVAPRVR